MEKTICFFKENYLKLDDVYIHPLSPSTQYGLNVFEGIRGYFNKKEKRFYILELKKHIERLFNSANTLSLKHEYSLKQIEDVIEQLLIKNKFVSDVYFKIVLLVSNNGSWSQDFCADLFIIPWKSGRAFGDKKESLNMCFTSWERISSKSMPPNVKTGANYINSRYAFKESEKKNMICLSF